MGVQFKSIEDFISSRYGSYKIEGNFITLVKMECEKLGLNEEETASAIEKAQKKFRHHQAWVKLVEDSPMQVDCSWEEFLGNLDHVHVSFKKDGCTRIERFLFDGIGILLKDEKAFEHIVGAYIPAICSPEFLVHIPAKVIPAEFIKKYIKQKKKQEDRI